MSESDRQPQAKKIEASISIDRSTAASEATLAAITRVEGEAIGMTNAVREGTTVIASLPGAIRAGPAWAKSNNPIGTNHTNNYHSMSVAPILVQN